MDFYLIYYDNGMEYDDKDQRTIGVYTDYQKAVRDVESKGFVRDKSDTTLFTKQHKWNVEEICIREVELNKIFNDQFI